VVSINELSDLVDKTARFAVRRSYVLDAALRVRDRNSDNTMICDRGWTHRCPLRTGSSTRIAGRTTGLGDLMGTRDLSSESSNPATSIPRLC
jgi:hypothetical protein